MRVAHKNKKTNSNIKAKNMGLALNLIRKNYIILNDINFELETFRFILKTLSI